ncbi:annulin-like [Physella acuta]|uniref:annulin-like n=1 Tax=Physella acuta TaxID=109671 RepID=UPI0027DDA1C5|nr:annulin-like [Physella acuta]
MRRHNVIRPSLATRAAPQPLHRNVIVGTNRFNLIRQIYQYGNETLANVNNNTPAQPPIQKPDPAAVLTVVSLNLNIPANAKSHKTHKYDVCTSVVNPKLVVRRGQPFQISVTFSKEYDENKDDLQIVLEVGETPMESKDTRVKIILSHEDKPKEWGAKIASQKGTTLNIDLFTPPDSIVGKWTLKIDVVKKVNTSVHVFSYQHKDPFYILFNPWCKDDAVYMKDEKLLEEYVLNDTGKIYTGTKNTITGKPWHFAQFEPNALDVALFLLNISMLNWSARGNPVQVVRKISALANSSDDGGILTGNWSGDYKDGRSPLSWTGSGAIIDEYWKTKRPVKYGQCWVFSGITTTLCRALGIPARSVTNFSSAHDADGSITIDYHFTANGESDADKDCDSIWNFHVWNEVWMSRPDLTGNYGGWQVIDATPQELSNETYCCGPTSVAAIKCGEVGLQYDGPFVFAEVNADKVYWTPNANGDLEVAYIDKKTVGQKISTKAANKDEREDLTKDYKPDEDTCAERVAVLRANETGSKRKDIYKQRDRDIDFNVDQNEEATFVGGDFELSLRMKNRGAAPRSASGRIDVRTMFYTGVVAELVKSETFQLTGIKPGEENVFRVVATEADYDGKLKDGCMLDVTIWAYVEETDQYFTKKTDFRLRKPHLTIKAPSDATVGQEFKVEVSFRNPLSRDLTKCFVAVDGVTHSLNFPQPNVAGHSTFLATLPVTPTKAGQSDLIAIFNSNELDDINGAQPINVKTA